MINLKHKDLEVWKKSIALVSEVYELTKSLPREEQFSLTTQLRRSAISIPSNISEGIARPSLVESDTHNHIALKINYLTNSDIENLTELVNHTFAILSKLIQKIKNDESK